MTRTLNLARRHANKPGAIERAAAALRARGAPAKSPLTLLEAKVLAHVSLRQDPWDGVRGRKRSLDVPRDSSHVGSRKVSQALGRLRRKGFVDRFPLYNITPSGESALSETFRFALLHQWRPW